ncbi:MAG: hypothetical protein A2070_01630 [Bdellovibrionales bacterium GWC1_52_8]|nr:MAG: hypothetical protein A2Z97_11700 [Bdellovibrionales bacterium GWB1_52_6]OFZ05387.1 MAG: hypothetical protein A2X97_16650 [Bdellovibrionales bacterium GWA1_52_35]OFZ43085.1 MAG: hypothetical protein A2070_01630 [Bdellovibrionales bacterium GWC1_52_8]
MTHFINVCGLAFTVMTFSAFAEEKMAVDPRGPCSPDIEKFCKDVEPGEGRLLRCLKEHENELSSDCKEKGQVLKKKMQGAKDACKADVQKFCKGVKPGKRRLMRCMKAHESELSAECKTKVRELKKR